MRSSRLLAILPTLLVSAGVLFFGFAEARTPAAPRGQDLYRQGVAHEHGEGVARDLERAAALYCEAARLGDAEAMFALGWMYANGRGLERNDARASGLFKRAGQKGHEHALRMLRFTGEVSEEPACLKKGVLLVESPRTIDETLRRLSPERRAVAKIIVELAPEYQVSPTFALAIAITESALNPAALSPKNAMGVMQLIPDTARRFKVRDAFDPRENIKGGLAYLRWLLAYFEGDIVLTAAAYNAGEGAVERHRGVPPYRETRAYVDRIVRLVGRQHHPFDSRVVQSSTIMPALRVAAQAPAP